MSLFTELAERARALLRSARQEREAAEELRFHIERDVEERVRHGADPAEARRAALAALGGVEHATQRVRDARGIRPLQDLAADVRYTFRSLRRDPLYTAAAILVLGLGLGAAATVLAVAKSVLFAPLPYPESHRLVRVGQLFQPNTSVWQLSTVDAQAILEQQRSFEAFGLVGWSVASLAGAGAPERIAVGRVTAGFFDALQVAPQAGRLLAPADEASDAAPVVVLSHALAGQRFGGAAAALGRSVTLDGLSHAVVGVLPPGRDVLGPGIRAAAWPVLRLDAPTRRGPFWLRGVGRLRRDVSLDAATRDLAAISERIFPLWAAAFRDETARLTPVPLRDSIVGGAARSVGLFAAAVILMQLVAIVNVATLSLVRASARAPELAVRAALGAGRLRLVRLPLLEGVVLGVAAGLAGLALAALGVALIPRFATNLPRLNEVALDGGTAGLAALAALASGLLVSVPPALAALRRSATAAPRGDHRRTGANRRTTALRGALVVTEFALALPLLLGASLLFRSFLRLQEVHPGFDPEGAVSVSLALPASQYPGDAEMQRFWRELERRAAAVPSVTAAAVGSDLPPGPVGNVNNFDLIDRPVPPGGAEHLSPWLSVTPAYFAALGIPLLEGRMFTELDSAGAPPVGLVSRGWVQRYYPGESAVGRQMIAGGCTTCPPTTVIGVVDDAKYLGLTAGSDAIYSPPQGLGSNAFLVVRSRAPAAATFRALRDVVAGLDPELPVVEQTMADRLDTQLTAPARSTAVLASFALVGMLLAALGIFGLMSYAVRRRHREIGVRIALGAGPAAITRMIVTRGMRYAGAGTAAGLGLAVLEARWIQAYLFETAATDPLTIVGAAAVLLFVAVAACWLPGLRAARIDPVRAIAAE